MLWRRSAPPLTISVPAPVPDAEALRRAALQASWQRGRWVARRRVAWRWLVWATTRFFLPALLAFALAAGLWLGGSAQGGHLWQTFQRWSGQVQLPAEAPVDPVTVVPTAPAPDNPPANLPVATPEPVAFSPEGEELPLPLPLKLETRWAAGAQPTQGPATAAPGVNPQSEPNPTLTSENWLHSKEP